jgi:NADP-dependent 3-hydroxy acid dehydrogenase YdfG
MPLHHSDVWFITGCSTGLGRELAKLVLDRGYRAVVTARDPSRIQDLTSHHDGRAFVLKLDVTDKAEAADVVKQAEAKFCSIDVLVNNA